MNQAWSMITWLIQCAFDWAYLKTTQWKVPKRRQKPHKPTKRRNNINRLHARGQRLIIVNESRTKRTKPTSRTVLFDTDTKAIGIDNRCSACISHDINDFVGPVHKSDKVISAFGGRQQMRVYKGTIVWSWLDDNGVQSKFRIPNSYFVPEGKSRLLSPQHWASTQPRDTIQNEKWFSTTHADRCVLHYGKSKLTIPISKTDNVATFYSTSGYNKIKERLTTKQVQLMDHEDVELRCEVALSRNSPRRQWSRRSGLPISKRQAKLEAKMQKRTSEQPRIDFSGLGSTNNLHHETQAEIKHSSLSNELLLYHKRFGHIPFTRLYEMARQGIIPGRLAHATKPVCAACMYAKATKRGWRDKARQNWTNNRVNSPGQCVSVDQLISPTPGLIAQLKGKLTKSRYTAATVYVDQSSGYGYVHLQKGTTAEETLEGKKAFEMTCEKNGVRVSNYHADNGIFRANEWRRECARKGQGLTFSGVNAHHTNGLAERRIRSLQDLARSMLIDVHRKWGISATASLWPYAILMANDTLNQTPNMSDETKRSPLQTFSNTEVQVNSKHWAPFGCPAYVLVGELQNQKRIYNKWDYRSKVGIYLGRSPNYGRNIALILNRDTGLVSPQFHVKFDPTFQSIGPSIGQQWISKAGLDAKTSRGRKVAHPKRKRQVEGDPLREGAPIKRKFAVQAKPEHKNVEATLEANKDISDNQPDDAGNQTKNEIHGSIDNPAEPARPKDPEEETGKQIVESTLLQSNQRGDETQEIFALATMFDKGATEYDEDPLMIYKATSDPDTMYHHEAMREKDADQFREAMVKEWNNQVTNGNFTIITRSQLPHDATVLPAVWQMKRKRNIKSGEVKKYKARLNIDGSKMIKGKHYELTYAPVVRWFSVRLLLILSIVNKWHTTQIDYVLAYPQAPIERDLYMEIPRGLELKGKKKESHVLKLHRNIYGQKQAGRVWYRYLQEKLTSIGFKKSEIDEGVFYRGRVVYILYTDDSILAAPTKEEVDKTIRDIKGAGLNVTIEGDINDFLGVHIEKVNDNEIKMTQPHLMKQIIKDMGMNEQTKPRKIPAASSKILKRHQQSQEHDKSFNYRSVVGKLNYLEKSTRPDISYSTHQCARFVEDPRAEHSTAIRQVVRYIKGTMDKGIIMMPNKQKGLEVYVDADFAGAWDKTDTSNRDTARSRHGYAICYNGVPITWKSQLQHEIALSTTEAEYTGLSYALREAIPIMNLLKEMKERKINVSDEVTKVHCKVYEDNSGAIEIAREDKYRPRTKHLNCRLHHFRTYVDSGEISINKIDTYWQPADILTKPLNEEDFTRHRKRVMGW